MPIVDDLLPLGTSLILEVILPTELTPEEGYYVVLTWLSTENQDQSVPKDIQELLVIFFLFFL